MQRWWILPLPAQQNLNPMETDDSQERNISFTITDGTDAVGGATVTIDNDISKTTGSAGGCTASLTDGEHTVVVSKEGYTSTTETITVSEDNTSFTITISEDDG